jgi:cell division protein FtsN
MAKNEDGEFELILGNRQLLSVFFIVVILLGVFFTMGYIVGRNSGGPVDTASAKKPDSKPLYVDSPGRSLPPNPGDPEPKTAVEKPVETKPDTAPAKVEKKPEPKVEKKPEVKKAEPKPVEVASGGGPQNPSSGQTYLQVAATGRPEAEVLTETLAKKGFKSIYTQIPEKPTLFRVLVGPLKDANAIGDARTELQKSGFRGFDAIKKTF